MIKTPFLDSIKDKYSDSFNFREAFPFTVTEVVFLAEWLRGVLQGKPREAFEVLETGTMAEHMQAQIPNDEEASARDKQILADLLGYFEESLKKLDAQAPRDPVQPDDHDFRDDRDLR